MIRHILFLILFLSCAAACQALTFDKNWWYDFEGTLGGMRIQLSVYIPDSGAIQANYCYKKYETKIPLKGELHDGQITLTEYLDGKPNGHFSGRIFTDSADRMEGTWTGAGGAKDFKLTMISAVHGAADHRYLDFSGTDEDVAAFMKQVKTAILKGDKQWIAAHTRYPLNTSLNGGKTIRLKNKQQLIEHFSQIFHAGFREQIQASCVCNMFTNYQGIMLGSGQIWIDEPAGKTPNYKIIAINN